MGAVILKKGGGQKTSGATSKYLFIGSVASNEDYKVFFDSRPQPRVKIVLYNPKSTSRMLYKGLSHEEASKSRISMRDEPKRIVRIIQSHYDAATNFFM